MKTPSYSLIAIALLFGVLAWTVVSLREHFVVSLRAPLEVTDIPDGWAIETPLPQTLDIRLRGEGWPLAGVLLGRPPRIRFSMNFRPGASRVFLRGDVADQISLPEGVTLLDVKPDSLHVDLDRAVSKRVPVQLIGQVSFRDGYGQTGALVVAPESVTVTGAETVLRSIKSWKTDRYDFDDLKGSVDENIPLSSSGTMAVILSTRTVNVSLNVEPVAERVLPGIPIEATDLPLDREVIFLPPRLDVTVRAGIKQLAGLQDHDLHASASYVRIASDSTGMVPVEVECPQGFQVVSRRPDKVHYVVRKRS
jgi:hypothetical protein